MGLSFINSFFLWGLAAAAIPVIIHLIKRNKAVKLPFAAMRFLQIEPNRKTRNERLKQILLLLMRIAAMILLALAFARPFLSNMQAGALWGEQQQAAVILVDNSLSMTYDDHFEKATDEAKKILRTFNPGDHVTLIEFSETSRSIIDTKSDFGLSANLLDDRLELSKRATNYAQAIQTAESILLESPHPNKIIYIISDFQTTGWDHNKPQVEMQPGVELIPVKIGSENTGNIAIQDLRVIKRENSRSGDVLARVRNFSGKPETRKINLSLNGKNIAQQQISLPIDDEVVAQFRNVPFPRGWASGFVEVSGNEPLQADNRYYFVQENEDKTEILAVNGEPTREKTSDELFFVDRAINLPRVAAYSLVQTEAADLSKYDFNQYRAVILANVQRLDRNTIERLKFYVRSGGGLIIALGDQIIPEVFNQLYKDLMPAHLTGTRFATPDRENGAVLAKIDYQHPIFKLFSDPGQGDPTTAQFYQFFQTEPADGVSVTAYFDDGYPAILESTLGAGKVLLFTSSFDTEWTNLPVKALFLPILYQSLHYVAAEEDKPQGYLVGNPISLRSTLQGLTQPGYVKLPSGERMEPKDEIFTEADHPGIYEIYNSGNRLLAQFAVNVDPRESDLTGSTEEALQEIFSPQQDKQPAYSATISQAGLQTQREQEQKFWRFGILAVVLLLVGETWLANRTYR